MHASGCVMGAFQSAPRVSKGVSYSPEGEITDCVFCRIADGTAPNGAPLWYNDGKVVVFVPRTPDAALHFLVVPVHHVQNCTTLTEVDTSLLLHMRAVALQMLRTHGARQADITPLGRCASPPNYAYQRDCLDSGALATANEEDWSLDFHWPPFNSIDHLHLHALHAPFNGWWSKIRFMRGVPWTGSVEDALAMAAARSQSHHGQHGPSLGHESAAGRAIASAAAAHSDSHMSSIGRIDIETGTRSATTAPAHETMR